MTITITVHNKSEAGTSAGIKFFMLMGRYLAVDFCHTKAIYDYYKSMVGTSLSGINVKCKPDCLLNK